MPFCAFVSDQQKSLCLKAILESLAPDNSYVISLYPAPIRQLATCDIGWGNVNNPQGGRRNSEHADSTHSAFLLRALTRRHSSTQANDDGITQSSLPLVIERAFSTFGGGALRQPIER